jgi:subtilisin family serine protease
MRKCYGSPCQLGRTAELLIAYIDEDGTRLAEGNVVRCLMWTHNYGEPHVFQTRRARSVLAGVAVAAVATALSVAGVGSAHAEQTSDVHKHAQIMGAGAKGAIKDSYIVVLKNATKSTVSAKSTSLTKTYGGTVTRTYKSAIQGYAAHMTEAQAKKLAASPDVKLVAQNKRYSTSDTQLNTPSWGLDRLDQIFAPLNKRYTYPNTASNVHAYVIDTGIRVTHSEFGGRATSGYDFVDNDANADDCDGHGTHVAGTIGGANYGVAKSVQLVAVRVLNCEGSGDTAGVVAGIDWVTAHAVKPAVANMSLGSDLDTVLDMALNNSINAGISYAVAAGNDSADACDSSPAHVSNAITVGASDQLDFRATFSNWGGCVDIFAPGDAIPSAWNTSDTATNTISGTSMASPHVAGAAALALSANPTWTPTQVRNFLVYGGTRRVVRNVAAYAGTTDVMLRVGVNPVPQVTGLRSLTNGKNISVGSNGLQPIKPLSAPQTMGDQEKFTTLAQGDGYYSFASWVNGKNISATNGGAGSLIANAGTVTDAEKFKPVLNGDGTVSLIAKINGKYVTAPSSGTAPLVASASTIGTAEKFIWASPSAIAVLRAQINGKLVTTPNNGASALIPTVTAAQGAYTEQFDMLDLGGDLVAFRAHSNKKFVNSRSNGTQSLLANSTSITAVNQFWYYNVGDGLIAFQSASGNGYFVQSPGTGSALIANYDIDATGVVTDNMLFTYEPIKVG